MKVLWHKMALSLGLSVVGGSDLHCVEGGVFWDRGKIAWVVCVVGPSVQGPSKGFWD